MNGGRGEGVMGEEGGRGGVEGGGGVWRVWKRWGRRRAPQSSVRWVGGSLEQQIAAETEAERGGKKRRESALLSSPPT